MSSAMRTIANVVARVAARRVVNIVASEAVKGAGMVARVTAMTTTKVASRTAMMDMVI